MYTQTTTGNDSGYGHHRRNEIVQAQESHPEEASMEEEEINEKSYMRSEPKEWKPSRSELLRDHPIHIRFLTIGCVIEVGCKSIPFTTIAEGMQELNSYVADPLASKIKWEKLIEENK